MNFNVYICSEMVEKGCYGEYDKYRSAYFFTPLTEDQIKKEMVRFCDDGNDFNWFDLFRSLQSNGILIEYFDDGCVDLNIFGNANDEIFVDSIKESDILSDESISAIKRRKEEQERIRIEEELAALKKRAEEQQRLENEMMIDKLTKRGYTVTSNDAQ